MANQRRTMYSLSTTDNDGLGIRVEYTRTGDRFRHEICVVEGNLRQLAALSVEGTPEQHWPPSPPVQEVHQQGDVLFLTGMAGASYWSASVSFESPGTLLFDVACRTKLLPDWLGSRYAIEHASADLLRWEPADAIIEITGETNSKTIALRPIDTRQARGTVRWSYRISTT